MKVYQTLILMAICCIVNLVHAQDIHGGGSHDGTYWPGSGVTIWEDSPIGRVIYWPEGGEGRLTLTDEGIYYDIDCAEDPARCKALLEGANGVPLPDKPDTPVETPSDPGKGKKKNDGMHGISLQDEDGENGIEKYPNKKKDKCDC